MLIRELAEDNVRFSLPISQQLALLLEQMRCDPQDVCLRSLNLSLLLVTNSNTTKYPTENLVKDLKSA
jgi:hypothetical protein